MITLARARKLRALLEKASESLSDEDALNAIEFYAKWDPGVSYAVG